MSQSPMEAYATRWTTESSAERTFETDDEVDRVLALLHDEDCRAILDVTTEGSWSANDLSDACDIPNSTLYRKLDRLTDAGLLEDHLDIRRSGRHTREYTRCVESVNVTVGADGFRVVLEPRADREQRVGFTVSDGW